MEKKKFPGGIHAMNGSDKALTMDLPVQSYEPDQVTILAEQSPGGSCSLLVSCGDEVTKGMLIGKPEAFMAAPLHASVTGKVIRTEEVENLGRKVTACVVQREQQEEQQEEQEYETALSDLSSYGKDEIIAAVRDNGLTGMGGAGFPTWKKYITDQKIHTLLINAAECEPYLTCDFRLMLEKGYAAVNGVRLLLKASGAEKARICIEDNKLPAAERLREILQRLTEEFKEEKDTIEVCVLPTRYPQGGERQLIQSVLGTEVPSQKLPADVGVIVSNIGTAKAAADAILGKKTLTHRIVTVTGCVKHPGNYLVPIGTSARELLLHCGGVTEKKNRIIAGGPMTGPCAAVDWDGTEELFYICKNTSGILVLPDFAYDESPCIRCGGCERVCPAGLTPWKIDFAYLDGDYSLCEELYAAECIACGCCSYTCPAKRDLAVRTRMARDTVKQRMRERMVKKS